MSRRQVVVMPGNENNSVLNPIKRLWQLAKRLCLPDRHFPKLHNENSSIKKYVCVVGFIVLFYALSFPAFWNSNVNCTLADGIIQNVTEMNAYDRPWLRGLSTISIFPPVYIYSLVKISKMVNHNWAFSLFFTNMMFLAVLIYFQYLLVREFGDNSTAILSVVLVLLYPLTFLGFNTLSLEFPLMGILMMSLYCLIRSRFFENTLWSVLFAAACGIGMMIKQPFGAYCAGIIAIGAVNVLINVFRRRIKPLSNLFIFAAIFILIISPYYILPHLSSGGAPAFKSGVMESFMTIVNVEPDVQSKRILFQGLWESQLSPPFFLLMLFGIFYFLGNTRSMIKLALFSCILIPNIFLYIMPHFVTPRYTMPCMPLYAVISAYGLRHLLKYKHFQYLVYLCVVIGLVQFYSFVYADIKWSKVSFNGLNYWSGCAGLDPHYLKRERQGVVLNNINNGIKKHVLEYSKHAKISVGQKYSLLLLVDNTINDQDISHIHCSMIYYPWFNNMSYQIVCGVKYYLMSYIYKGEGTIDTIIDNTDFILYTTLGRTNIRGEIPIDKVFDSANPWINYNPQRHDLYMQRWGKYLKAFELTETYYVNDRYTANLYMKKKRQGVNNYIEQ
ncbi:MAG: glycosyltransferase family 39 protein [Elusimicrobia bacterium]|nr:glycosyltransferase family 39 protein [Elusimicrobiota bacterium]